MPWVCGGSRAWGQSGPEAETLDTHRLPVRPVPAFCPRDCMLKGPSQALQTLSGPLCSGLLSGQLCPRRGGPLTLSPASSSRFRLYVQRLRGMPTGQPGILLLAGRAQGAVSLRGATRSCSSVFCLHSVISHRDFSAGCERGFMETVRSAQRICRFNHFQGPVQGL